MPEQEKPARAGQGSLDEGAVRLGRVARILKETQLSRTTVEAAARPALPPAPSPDEAWAAKYMNQTVGPTVLSLRRGHLQRSVAPLPRLWLAETAVAEAPSPPPPAAPGGPIGQVVGKGMKRRSWLDRFLGR